jgi:hypothetical protein
MPTLPIFYRQPFPSLRAVMLFPSDMSKAEACAAWILMKACAGRKDAAAAIEERQIGRDLLRELSYMALNHSTAEAERNAMVGGAVGAIVVALLALRGENPDTAGLDQALDIASTHASRSTPRGRKRAIPGGVSNLRSHLSEFASVAHIWGAWACRGHRWLTDESVDYSFQDDFGMFLAESEAILKELIRWDSDRHEKARSKFLKADFFKVSEDWRPPKWRTGWPMTGVVPAFTLDRANAPHLPASRGPQGRPATKPL